MVRGSQHHTTSEFLAFLVLLACAPNSSEKDLYVTDEVYQLVAKGKAFREAGSGDPLRLAQISSCKWIEDRKNATMGKTL